MDDDAFALYSRDESMEDPAPLVGRAVWAMFIVSTVFLGLRMYCRIIRLRIVWWDDHLLIAGWALLLIANVLITELMMMGFGIDAAFEPRSYVLSKVVDDLNKVALGLTKTSFAVTLLRISTGWQKHVVWSIIISLNLVLGINTILTWMAVCDGPGLGRYDASLPGCWRMEDSIIIAMVALGYSVFCDFVLPLLSLKFISGERLKSHDKIGVAAAFSFALLAGVAGIMKLYQLPSLAKGNNIPYQLSMLYVWGQAEPFATVCAASIPVLRILLQEGYPENPGQTPPKGIDGYIGSENEGELSDTRDSPVALKKDHVDDQDWLDETSEKNVIFCTTQVAVKYDRKSQLFKTSSRKPTESPVRANETDDSDIGRAI